MHQHSKMSVWQYAISAVSLLISKVNLALHYLSCACVNSRHYIANTVTSKIDHDRISDHPKISFSTNSQPAIILLTMYRVSPCKRQPPPHVKEILCFYYLSNISLDFSQRRTVWVFEGIQGTCDGKTWDIFVQAKVSVMQLFSPMLSRPKLQAKTFW